MSNFSQKTLMVATVTILGLGITGTAYAGGKAFSALIIDNFVWKNANTNTQLDLSDFSSGQVGDSARNSASLNNVGAPTHVDTRNVPPGTSLGVADPSLSCVGPDCSPIGQNMFTERGGLNQFSRADSLLEGAVITGTGATDINGNSLNSARASQVSEVQINRFTGSGAADSTVSDGSTFTFSLPNSIPTTFSFRGLARSHVLLNQPDIVATSSRSFTITIREGTSSSGPILFSWNPNGASGGITGGTEIQDPFALNFTTSQLDTGQVGPNSPAGSFQARTNSLPAGTPLTISIASTVGSNLSLAQASVPEPATLALLSAGLLGMGLTYRRRKI